MHRMYDANKFRTNLASLQGDVSDNRLAELCGVPQTTISRLKRGFIKIPAIDTLATLADYFGVTVSQLIGETPLIPDKGLAEIERAYQYMPGYKRNTALAIVKAIAAEPDAPYQ